jgi:hypothetical protein
MPAILLWLSLALQRHTYFQDFRRAGKCAMIKFVMAIETCWSLKLHQMWQVMFAFLLPPTQSTSNMRPSGHYREVGRDVDIQVSKPTPSHHTSSFPSSHSPRLPWQGGFVTPRNPPPPLNVWMQPETELSCSVSGFLVPTLLPASRLQTCCPVNTVSCYEQPHRYPPPPSTTAWHSQPRTKHGSLVSNFWPQPLPLPCDCERAAL